MKWYYIGVDDAIYEAGDFEKFIDARHHVSRVTGCHTLTMFDGDQARGWLATLDRLIGTRVLTHDQLWEAQLRFNHTSIRLTFHEVRDWANASFDDLRCLHRWRSIAMALQNSPCHVWYRTKPFGGSMGCRYGLEAHQYFSGFDDL